MNCYILDYNFFIDTVIDKTVVLGVSATSMASARQKLIELAHSIILSPSISEEYSLTAEQMIILRDNALVNINEDTPAVLDDSCEPIYIIL